MQTANRQRASVRPGFIPLPHLVDDGLAVAPGEVVFLLIRRLFLRRFEPSTLADDALALFCGPFEHTQDIVAEDGRCRAFFLKSEPQVKVGVLRRPAARVEAQNRSRDGPK